MAMAWVFARRTFVTLGFASALMVVGMLNEDAPKLRLKVYPALAPSAPEIPEQEVPAERIPDWREMM